MTRTFNVNEQAREKNIVRAAFVAPVVTIVRLALLCCLAMMTSACSELSETSQRSSVDSPPAGVVSGFSLPIPDGFATMRKVDLERLYAVVSVTGEDPLTFRQSEPISVRFRVTRGDIFTANIRWFEEIAQNDDLLLAAHTVRQVVTDSVNLDLDSSVYLTVGTNFDADRDGFSNLEERRAGSDPLDAAQTPDTLINAPNVRLGRVDPSDAPIIDGLYDDIYTTRAQFNDDRGELLSIDNLMIDQGAIRADGQTEFRWFGMHDDTFLYLFVLGENIELANPIRDSTQVFQDDSIDIFIDGNNSKGTSFDGMDDRHFLIPLLTDPDNIVGSNSTVIALGPNSASLPPIEFGTCLCTTGQHTWEVKLPLAQFGITKDTPFGLEIQLNLDNDGGTRDAKWGWFHPSRVSDDVDNTFMNPSFMGTAVIR